eukprot:TRINITY_DN5283_c0_g1_i1.p1 TRINITY_DN5283_c0_g1~~TRINITY_DN5283_c0_g1_i1.p1  ORF type:complete len:272 (-),score=42.11 TRINITY_DN5283_c0_g1_i1:48-863(-)
MKTILTEHAKRCEKDTTFALSVPLVDDAKAALDAVPMYGPFIVDHKMAQDIGVLWSDPAIKRVYETRSKLQIPDMCAYFFDKVDIVGEEDFLPSNEDIIRCTFRTTGIREIELELPVGLFKVVDVGGQRSERSKWIHCFELCSAVIFFGAISEYDQVLREDNTVNRLEETLKLFEEISNSRWFRDCTMILFLNKIDLFREKLKTAPFKSFAPDYEGGECFDAACRYLKGEFESRCTMKSVYTNFTSVIDGTSVKQLFGNLTDLVLRMHLEK